MPDQAQGCPRGTVHPRGKDLNFLPPKLSSLALSHDGVHLGKHFICSVRHVLVAPPTDQASTKRERLQLVRREGERRHEQAFPKDVPNTSLAVDRSACSHQGVEIPVDCADRNLEVLCHSLRGAESAAP
jgi:hypothetical protein